MFCTCFFAWYTRIIIQNLLGELIAREPESGEGIRGVAVVSSFVYVIHFNEETSWSGSGERRKGGSGAAFLSNISQFSPYCISLPYDDAMK